MRCWIVKIVLHKGRYNYHCLQPFALAYWWSKLELNTATDTHKTIYTTSKVPGVYLFAFQTGLFVWKAVKHLALSFRGKERRNGVGRLKWIILQERKNWGRRRGKKRGRLSSNRCFFPQSSTGICTEWSEVAPRCANLSALTPHKTIQSQSTMFY